MTSDAHATIHDEPKHGHIVIVNRREAVFLYRRGAAAFIRYSGEDQTRAVPLTKLRWRNDERPPGT